MFAHQNNRAPQSLPVGYPASECESGVKVCCFHTNWNYFVNTWNFTTDNKSSNLKHILTAVSCRSRAFLILWDKRIIGVVCWSARVRWRHQDGGITCHAYGCVVHHADDADGHCNSLQVGIQEAEKCGTCQHKSHRTTERRALHHSFIVTTCGSN